MKTITPEFYFNPFDPKFRADPYPYYERMLAEPPRIVKFVVPVALVSRYDDVTAVIRDHDRYSSVRPRSLGARVLLFDTATMPFSDPPVHTRLRRLIGRVFAPRRIADLRPKIERTTHELLDAVPRGSTFDAMSLLADPLPVAVISEILGVPYEHHEMFKSWAEEIAAADNVNPRLPATESAVRAVEGIRRYFSAEIERRRSRPGHDLISSLVEAEDGEVLMVNELLDFVVLLMLGGIETTSNLIGNGLLALCRHPEQLERLLGEPSLLPGAIEEIMRYDSPIQIITRQTKENVNLGGTDISAGSTVTLIIGAANRDSARFRAPNTFDITRSPNEHLALGDGIHFCIGSALARLESSIAISSVLDRFPNLTLSEPNLPLSYKKSFAFRGLKALPLRG